MNVGIGTETAQFLFWDYFFEIFSIVSLQCSCARLYSSSDKLQISLCNGEHHGLMNYIDTTAKCRHLKQLTCKGALRQMFIRVYRLKIQSIMLVFSIQLCERLPQ
jgi:hypothetical protein